MNHELKALMETSVDTLAKRQFDALKAHVVKVLQDAAYNINACQFDKIPTFYSPGGDDAGCDNTCLDFSWCETQGPYLDIGNVISKLKELKKVAGLK